MTDLRQAAEMALEALKETGSYLPVRSGVEREVNEAKLALSRALAQPEHEPVAWANSSDLENFDMRVRTNRDHYHTVPLYTAPPKKEWVGLTGDEISECWGTGNVVTAVEAKLKEKNCG